MRAIIAAAALALTGCAPNTPEFNRLAEYTGHPSKFETRSGPFRAYHHPMDNAVMVAPDDAVAKSFERGLTLGGVNNFPTAAEYRTAAAQFVRTKGAGCTITSDLDAASPFREYLYSC